VRLLQARILDCWARRENRDVGSGFYSRGDSISTHPAVQVNGRARGVVQLSPHASQAEALAVARQVDAARKVLDSDSVERVVYVPRRIINLVSKS